MNSISAPVLLLHPLLSYPWLTNQLITFFVLLSRYPILQYILNYYSLIGAVYLCRRCVWFQFACLPHVIWLFD